MDNVLTKSTVVPYLRAHENIMLNDPVTVNEIGDGSLGADVEGDGCCNYVFRVSDGEHSYILKQSTGSTKKSGMLVPADRNQFEYEIMKIRADIVPQYVPKVYFTDPERNLYVMEDVSYLKLIRFQLAKNHIYPNLPSMIAEYLAATHFYTSEFYMDAADYRKQMAHFMNPDERVVCEDDVFLKIFGADDYDPACGEKFREYCENIRKNPNLQFQRFKLRHLFQSKSECLIHGDFHTSNIFADDSHMKVIDMEYTFGAPFSYDLGFFISNIITQYSSAVFRPFDSEDDRKRYTAYLLSVIEMLYTQYIKYFMGYWDKDAKPVYQRTPCYKEVLALDILHEVFGFAACYNFARVRGTMATVEFDSIEDNTLRTKAKYLSIDIDKLLFEKWSSYDNVKDIISDIIAVTKRRLNTL